MGYFSSSDYELCYNKSSVDSSISRIYDLLDKVERYRLHMIDDVSSLERNAHDVVGTSVDEDYKDFEYILNEDGIQLFETPANVDFISVIRFETSSAFLEKSYELI